MDPWPQSASKATSNETSIMLKVALVGRPNVGKSTLFNRLTGDKQAAVVSPLPGLTRDRHYAVVNSEDRAFILIDTGGLKGEGDLATEINEQTRYAINECDLICFLVAADEGLAAIDESLAMDLRRSNKPMWLIVNKIDKQDERFLESEFSTLGINPCFYISATSKHGISSLRQEIVQAVGQKPIQESSERVGVAFIGRPNSGKSTLINTLIKENRLVTSDIPGTTRDSITIPFSYVGRKFSLIDTAGVRRKSRAKEEVERFSIIRSFESIVLSDVVVLLCDATEGMTDQDANLASQVVEQGKPLLIAVNKSDLLTTDMEEQLERTLDKRLQFISYVEIEHISALLGKDLKALMRNVARVHDRSIARIPTSKCNVVLRAAFAHHPPPLVAGRSVAMRYMCQTGTQPPKFAIHGKYVDRVSQSYKRYLASYFRKHFSLNSIPIEIEFRLSNQEGRQ